MMAIQVPSGVPCYGRSALATLNRPFAFSGLGEASGFAIPED